MIEQIADRIAVKIKETSPEDTASIEVMKFALIGILHNTTTLIAALVAGALLGKFPEVLLTAIAFTVLRLISGGYHFKSALSCFIFSSIIFIAIPFIVNVEIPIFILNTISLIMCLIFAPSNIKEHIRVPEKYFYIFKVLSVLVVALNYFFDNPIITLAFLAQSFTLITWKRKEVKSND